MALSKRKIECSGQGTGIHRPIAMIVVAATWSALLCGQSDDCESGILHASRIVCESTFLPLEMQGFSEYLPPADPDEVPRKYLVERWSGVRQVHHVHSGGSFTQHLAFSGEWRFGSTEPGDSTTKNIDYLIHRYATGKDETGSCPNLRTGINGLPGGGCADYACGELTVEATSRSFSPSAEGESCANGYGYYWTSEDTVSEELLELDTEENAMIRAEAEAIIGSSSHSFANDFERNWDVYDRTRSVAFHAQKVRFFALFPLTCPGTYTVLYAYRKWPIGSDRPEEPNHFETDSATFTEWSSRAPGQSSWIEIPLEKGMNMEIADAAIFNTCGSTSAGTVETRLSSVDLSISLGGDPVGNPYGVVLLRSPGVTADLAQPGALQFWNSNPAAVEVIRDSEDLIESIRTPHRLVRVATVSPTAFRMDHYLDSPESPGPETPPDITQEISFIDGPEDRILRISELAFGRATVREYRDSKSSNRIELITGDGLRREVLDRSVSDDGVSTETRSTYDDSDQLGSQTLERYREFPWGRSMIEVVQDPEGAALIATFSYFEDPATDGSAYGRIRERTNPSGHWLRYDYDSEGRINRLTEPFLNATEDADPDQLLERVFSYTTIPDQDADGSEEALETIDSRLLGQSIGRRFKVKLSAMVSFDGKPTMEGWELVATDPEAAWDDASNLKSVRRTISEGLFRDRIAQTWLPDDSAVFTRYEVLDGLVIITTEIGVEPDDEGRLQRGTINTRITGLDGHLTSYQTRDIETGLLLDQKVITATDARGRATRIEYLDGSYETLAHDCCGQSSGTDRYGLSFQSEYDGLGRVAARTTGGVRFEYTYDAADRLTERRRVHPESGADTVTRYAYDLAGRRRSETDEMGGTRFIAHSELPDGSQVETVTHPDGSETRTVRARDGRPLLIDGSRESPRRYDYGVNKNGFYTREIRIGDDDTETEWSETTSDFAARPHLIKYADGSQETRTFDPRGNLVSLEDRDDIRHLFESDPAGFHSIQAIDMNDNGKVDLEGPDRVTRTTRSLVIEDGEPIERTTTERWISEEAEPLHIADRWLTRRAQRESQGVLSAVTEAGSLPDGDMEITTTRTGEPVSRTTYRNGRAILKEIVDDQGQILRTTAFTHGPFGRQIEQNDSETGSVGFEYDDADRVTALVEQPAAGSEGSLSRRMTYSHDIEGRVTEVDRPDGTVEARDYSKQGRLLRIDAPRQPTTTYDYDTHGRRTRLGTHFTDTTDAVFTSWTFDAESGAILSKTTPDGLSTFNTTTPAGRPVTRTGPTGIESTFQYDPAGNLVSVSYSDETPSLTFRRDRAGRVTTLSDSLGQVALTYDSIDQVVREERTLDGTTVVRLERGFDPANRSSRLEITIDDTAITTEFVYDERGRLSEINHQGVRFHISRDDAGRIRTMSVIRDDGAGPGFQTSYDAFGRISSMSSIGEQTSAGKFFTAVRDLSGRVLNQTIFDHVRWNLDYDAKGWLSQATRTLPESQGSIPNDILYERDASGNITRRVNEGTGLAMTVNNLNQLVSREVAQGVEINGIADPETTVTVNRRSVERQGDLFRTEVPVDSSEGPVWQVIDAIAVVPEAGPNGEDAVTTTTAHRYVPQTPETFDHDAAGRLTRDGRWDYAWDAEDRLVTMQTREDVFDVIADPEFPQTRLEFIYDSLNRRVRKKVFTRPTKDDDWTTRSDTGFVYDGWKLIAELDLQEESKPIRSYAWGIDLSGSLSGAHGVGGLVAIHDHTTGTTDLPLTDGNGNIVGLIDTATGEIAARYDYEPYGRLLRISGQAARANPIRFSSRYHDNETGLVYFGRRYYSPDTGRWLSRDPLGEDAGPNLYAYADNDPINRIDPIGEDVYVVTRPLNIGQLSKAAPAAVHVYLAFDNKGIGNQAIWAAEVQHLNQGSGLVDPNGGKPYNADPSLVQTFSFHPDSVRTQEGSLNRFWTVSTESTYVAYNDGVDVDAFRNNAPGPAVMAFRIPISGIEDQLRLYRMAIASRNINNYHPEAFHPELYAFTRFNCSSWAKTIVETAGFNFPLDTRFGGLINGGVGTDNYLGKPLRAMTDVYDAGFESFEFIYSMAAVQYQQSIRLLKENIDFVTP